MLTKPPPHPSPTPTCPHHGPLDSEAPFCEPCAFEWDLGDPWMVIIEAARGGHDLAPLVALMLSSTVDDEPDRDAAMVALTGQRGWPAQLAVGCLEVAA